MSIAHSVPPEWQQAINGRAAFALNTLGLDFYPEDKWFDRIEKINSIGHGRFYAWLTITGCYPTKFELQKFTFDVQVSGLRSAVQNLILERSKVAEQINNLALVKFTLPSHSHMVDVTHTYSAPYLTGIQRVVWGVTKGAPGISTFIWIGTSGIIQERTLADKSSPDENDVKTSRNLDLINFLHSLVPTLDRSHLGRNFRVLMLPLARRIKRYLMRREVQFQLTSQEHGEWNNIFLAGCTISLPEIPSLIEHIGCYEAILEDSAVTVQVVLYDFIPFFHAWTVHPGNRGHLNSYVRIVLLAHRIISISALVQEQAKLIIQAFSLERESWGERSRSFDYLPLPSGLEAARIEEFSKDPQLLTMVGSLEPRKNHLQFLAALEILTARGVSFKARILGSAGWENEHILNRIYSLQVNGIDLERVGNLNDTELRSIIGRAQVLIQVSEAEGFGLPIAEALSLGTRVIVSNVSPLKEWAGERVSVVEIGNSHQLADQMIEYLQNPEKFGVIEAQSVSWKDWQNLLFT